MALGATVPTPGRILSKSSVKMWSPNIRSITTMSMRTVPSLGKTSRATRVFVNSEVAKCDLKIGIGSIVPHLYTGFGGGAKILLPGVCSMETIEANHESLRYTAMQTSLAAKSPWANTRKTSCVWTWWKRPALPSWMSSSIHGQLQPENTALFVGDVEEAYLAGAAVAQTHYATHIETDADVIVANCYGKGSEALLSLPACLPFFFSEPKKDLS